jgi:uncharacterized membrane protein
MTGRAADYPQAAERATMAMLNRMAIAVLALFGILVSLYMGAYSFGFMGSIVCSDGGCRIVQDSPWASMWGVPVPAIGLVGYGALFTVALAGLQPRFARSRIIGLLLAGGAVIGLAFSAWFTYLEAYVIHAWCYWCVGSAVVTVLIFLCTLPEFGRLRSPE